MTEPERKKDGQLLIPFEKQLQLAIQFKEKTKMIIDFSFPTLHKNEWIVRVIKTAPNDNLHPQTVRFENKDDAFKYYEQIRQLWQRQRE